MTYDIAQILAIIFWILTPVVLISGVRAIDNSARRSAGKPSNSWLEIFHLSYRSYKPLHWCLLVVTAIFAITLSVLSAEMRGIDLKSAWHLDVFSDIVRRNESWQIGLVLAAFVTLYFGQKAIYLRFQRRTSQTPMRTRTSHKLALLHYDKIEWTLTALVVVQFAVLGWIAAAIGS